MFKSCLQALQVFPMFLSLTLKNVLTFTVIFFLVTCYRPLSRFLFPFCYLHLVGFFQSYLSSLTVLYTVHLSYLKCCWSCLRVNWWILISYNVPFDPWVRQVNVCFLWVKATGKILFEVRHKVLLVLLLYVSWADFLLVISSGSKHFTSVTECSYLLLGSLGKV